MKKRVSLVVSATAILLILSMFSIFKDTVHAEIDDGTYEIEYEMKEADNDNTSIADGYFTSPATLTIADGVKHIQLTITSANMVKSLGAPTGDVEILDEDKEEETRTVKFEVDEALSKPIPLEMHVVVPDLYDTTHTARALFDTDHMDAVSSNQNANDATEDNSEEIVENAGNKNNAEVTDKDDEKAETDSDEDVSIGDAGAEVDSQDNDGSVSGLWITLAVLGVLIIVGILFWLLRKKRA